jgi:hypothetical protein
LEAALHAPLSMSIPVGVNSVCWPGVLLKKPSSEPVEPLPPTDV